MKTAILLATYNGEKYIKEMLDSLNRQTYQDFTCYIHDDDSQDETMNVVNEWIEKHELKDKYIVLEYEKTGSAKDNFFSMLREVEADYYLFADQDDVWLDNKVEKQVNTMLKKENGTNIPTVVYSDMYVTDELLNVLSDSMISFIGRDINRNKLSHVLIDNPAAGCTMIINRPLRDKALCFKNSGEILMHDQWLLCVGTALGYVEVIDEPLVYYRQHGFNEMGAETESRKDKVLRNVKAVASGKFAKEKRDFHQSEKNLAKQLLYVEGMPNNTRKFLMELISIDHKSKAQRMAFYRKHDLERKEHSVWMRLWV